MRLTEPEYYEERDAPEIDEDPQPDEELQAHWDAADEGDARYSQMIEEAA